MDFDLKKYFNTIIGTSYEFDLCILVKQNDLKRADAIKSFIKEKNPKIENHIDIFFDNPLYKVAIKFEVSLKNFMIIQSLKIVTG